MSLSTRPIPVRSWSVEAFGSFWGNPDPVRLQGVKEVITADIVGYWPRSIGVVRGAKNYFEVIDSIVNVRPRFSLKVIESAMTDDLIFIRWIGCIVEGGTTTEFNGCDRVRMRAGLVCENYVFCDHPFFESVAEHMAQRS